MAEAFFNHYARGQATGISAGTQPVEHINPLVARLMGEIGIDMSLHKPKILSYEMLGSASRVISMGCGVDASCPSRTVKTQDWGLEDPTGKTPEEVRRIRDEIERRVKVLLGEMGIEPGQ